MTLRATGIAFLAGGLGLAGLAAGYALVPQPAVVRAVPLPATAAKVLPEAPQVEALLGLLGPSLPDPVVRQVSDALVAEARRYGYDPLFLVALIGVESNYRLSAHSQRGARGLLQLKPSTFAWMAGREPDLAAHALESGEDPATDVRLAVRYFRWLERRFGSRTAALMAYNAGPRRYAQRARTGDFHERHLNYPKKVRREYARVIRLFEGKQPGQAGRVLLAGLP